MRPKVVNRPVQHAGFSITHDGSVVTVLKNDVAAEQFDFELSRALRILDCFVQSGPGSTWGCDGIGYECQKRIQQIRVNKSGVKPMAFKSCIERVRRLA